MGAADPDGDTLTYSVSGTDFDAFENFSLNTGTGAITVRTGATLDYETRTSYAVTVSVTDGKDAAGDTEIMATIDDMVAVTINVTDADDTETVMLNYSDPWAGVTVIAGMDGRRTHHADLGVGTLHGRFHRLDRGHGRCNQR